MPPMPPSGSRRITELDADYVRLQRQTARRLRSSVRELVRDLRSGLHPEVALSPFIHRHVGLLRAGYDAAHVEGQRDYYERVSEQPNRWLSDVAEDVTGETTARTRIAFYGVSVSRMATEALQACRQAAHAQIATTDARRGIALAAGAGGEDVGDALDQWASSVASRVDSQSSIVWPGLQDGYLSAAASDRAGVGSLVIWWELEEAANHCGDCVSLAEQSPFTLPGNGGNELPAVPADGYTQCGVYCRCGLVVDVRADHGTRPGPPVWNEQWKPKHSKIADVAIPAPVAMGGAYTAQQRAALDGFRSAARGWDAVRGVLPQAPGLFATATEGDDHGSLASVEWDALSATQQEALMRLHGAIGAWSSAAK